MDLEFSLADKLWLPWWMIHGLCRKCIDSLRMTKWMDGKGTSTVAVQRCVWMDKWMDGWMVGWRDGWLNGWMDEWMDGCMDG